MNFFHHKDLGNHLLQLCPKVVKHPVYCRQGQFSQCSDSLQGGRSGDRISVGGRDYPHPSRPTLWFGQPPTQWGMWALPGVKQLGRGADHRPTSIAEVKARLTLYLYFPSGSWWSILGRILPFTLKPPVPGSNLVTGFLEM